MTRKEYNNTVESYADGLYRFALGVVHNAQVAQDVVQDAFERLWINRKKVEAHKGKSWLFRVAYNLAISHWRVSKRESNQELEDFAMTAHAESGGWDDRTEIMWRELDRLSQKERTLVMLCDWEGYSYGEIAQIMELSDGQVKIGLHRARGMLRERLAGILSE